MFFNCRIKVKAKNIDISLSKNTDLTTHLTRNFMCIHFVLKVKVMRQRQNYDFFNSPHKRRYLLLN